MVSIAQLREVPSKSMILLVGLPGAGKSTFCQQIVLNSLAIDRPVIYVTTECGPAEVERDLRERGLGEIEPCMLHYLDAYNETVGLSVPDRPDVIRADCSNLSSIGIAISKLQERVGKKGVLLVFDSLISPYLLSGQEVIRFMRITLSKFVAEGNSILACMDEGCGKEEDLGAMISLSRGVLKMEVKEKRRWLDVIKHPTIEPTKIAVPTDKIWKDRALDAKMWDEDLIRHATEALQSGAVQKEFEQMTVNLFWLNLMRWSGMFLDPKRFPMITYEVYKDYAATIRNVIQMAPLPFKLYIKLFLSKSFSKVKDMKKLSKFMERLYGEKGRRDFTHEYLENISKTDEHYFRIHESYECWGFENVGAAMASMIPSSIAGGCQGLEKEERDWNAIETKCIGLGDPYCEVKLVPGEIRTLESVLEKKSSVIEKINKRLMNQIMRFLLENKPLVENRRLGSAFILGGNILNMAGGERYHMALRMGGAKVGKEVGQRLIDAQIVEDEAVNHILRLLKHCKVGDITMDKTIKIGNNRESQWTKFITEKWEVPSCFFTTGFLNGFFSAVRNQHVKETRCIAMGDPYCEWEFR